MSNEKEAQKPFILIEPMQRHINNGKAKIIEFKNNIEAVKYFREFCFNHNYEDGKRRGFEAGGIGHDFRIECFLNY
jgi:hypothetical protein